MTWCVVYPWYLIMVIRYSWYALNTPSLKLEMKLKWYSWFGMAKRASTLRLGLLCLSPLKTERDELSKIRWLSPKFSPVPFSGGACQTKLFFREKKHVFNDFFLQLNCYKKNYVAFTIKNIKVYASNKFVIKTR